MIIYILFKLLLSYFFVNKKGWIKEPDNLFFFIDFCVLSLYIIHVYNNGFVVLSNLLIISLVFLLLFSCYRVLHYLNNNSIKLVLKARNILGNKIIDKIKVFFLEPLVCKVVYYSM
jgi:hypothetical protein